MEISVYASYYYIDLCGRAVPQSLVVNYFSIIETGEKAWFCLKQSQNETFKRPARINCGGSKR